MSDDTMHEGEEAPPRGVRAMAIVRWVLILAAAAAATFSILHATGVIDGHRSEGGEWFCPMHPHVVQDHPGDCPICHMTLVERDGAAPPGDPGGAAAHAAADGEGAYWCPMHPEVHSDDPDATCELCGGMKLVPRPPPDGAAVGAGDPALAPLELSADRVQRMGVRTDTVARRQLAPTLRGLASVAAPETGWAQVTPRFPGWIERVLVSEVGARVTRGQALAILHSPELIAAQEEYLAALDWAAVPSLPGRPGAPDATPSPTPDDAPSPLAADARRRLELWGMSKADIDTITRTRKPLRTVTLRAPVAGHVLARGVAIGSYVQPGAVLYELADLSSVWAWIEVAERDLSRVAIGQAATLSVAAFAGEAFTGKLAFLSPTVDPVTRTLRARLVLPNKDGRLRPGMTGEASIALAPREVVAIPDSALIDTGGARYVYVARGEGRYEPRRVNTGERTGGWAELMPAPDGSMPVGEGDVVVTRGTFLLDAESRLEAQLGGGGGAGAGAGASSGAAPGHEGH